MKENLQINIDFEAKQGSQVSSVSGAPKSPAARRGNTVPRGSRTNGHKSAQRVFADGSKETSSAREFDPQSSDEGSEYEAERCRVAAKAGKTSALGKAHSDYERFRVRGQRASFGAWARCMLKELARCRPRKVALIDMSSARHCDRLWVWYENGSTPEEVADVLANGDPRSVLGE